LSSFWGKNFSCNDTKPFLRSDFCPICDWYNSGKRLSENPATLDFTGEFGFSLIIPYGDLSRLGRNYLEVGNLAEVFLPEHGCELISLNEILDDMMVFRNWFNEQHSKTTSIKVRSAKRISAQSGKFLGAYAPFGYKKDPQNRHKLIIDENAAPVVRRIFQMRLSGLGFRAIAVQLNKDRILCPREYYYQQKGSKNPLRSRKIWGETTIKDIIKNEVYLGHLVSGKTGTISYKNQKLVKKDEEDWVRVENTHAPLIDRETWDRVHSYVHRKYKPKRRSDGETNLFAGLLFCADCGFRLRGHIERRERKDGSEYRHASYMCGTYGNNGKDACTCHSIGEKVLVELVTEHIRKYASLLKFDEAHIVKCIEMQRSSALLSYQGSYESELEAHRKQLEKLDFLIENLCSDKASGVIPESLFKRQIMKHEEERRERNEAILLLEKRLKEIKPVTKEIDIWGKLIKRYAEIDSLDKETLLLLIDRIVVNESKVVDGKRVCDIQVVYNYVGDVDGVVAA
jgi:hypothetical protein